MLITRRRVGGFTLIELLIGMAIVAILLALGLPSMSAYIQNNKIGSAAANYYAGLQQARAEAIRRNVQIEFVLTDQTGVGAAPSVTGRNWVVRAFDPADPMRLVDQKTGLEGEGGAAQAIQIVAAGPAGFDGRILFGGLGTPGPPMGPYSIRITNPTVGACAPSGPARCRQINVTAGGQISACDPGANAASAVRDSRAC